jgi:hypothetical protein
MADQPTFTRTARRPAAPTNADGSLHFDPPAAPNSPPQTAQEAQTRFYTRYGPRLIQALLGLAEPPQPQTVDQWLRLAHATRDVLKAREAAQQ